MRKSAILAAVLMLSGSIPFVTGTAHALDWSLYVNERFGASADVPATGFVIQKPPPDRGGQSWISADGLAEISIYGSFTNDSGDWHGYRKERARQMINNGVDLVHDAGNDEWFVLSGVRDDRIRYTRAIRSPHCQPPVAVHVFLTYPLSEKNQYDRIVTHMARSLRAVPGKECSAQ